MKKLLVFVLGSLAFGLVSLAIGYAIWEQDALIQGGAAFGLAFVPGVLTFAWVVLTYRSAPETQLLAGLGSTGVRMAIALGGGYLLTAAKPQLFDMPFWSWLILFYLGLLAFEITLLVRQQPKLDGTPQT
jgi:hypothetical protein